MEINRFIPGAEATIRRLKRQGIKMAVLTNGEGKEQRAKLDKFGLSDFIDACLVEGELGFGKPDPRVYQMALERLAVENHEAWIVGDRLNTDIIGAQNGGIFSIWLDHNKKSLPSTAETKPDRVVTNISELFVL